MLGLIVSHLVLACLLPLVSARSRRAEKITARRPESRARTHDSRAHVRNSRTETRNSRAQTQDSREDAHESLLERFRRSSRYT